MDRDLSMNLVRLTEAAAIGAGKYLGLGQKNLADGAAVDNMRKMFDTMAIEGEVVIGEGEMDEAPMLYIGEKIGISGMGYPRVDIAVDPIDGTEPLSKGINGALAVVALAPQGTLLRAPDMYMEKLVVGPGGRGAVSLAYDVETNLRQLARALGKELHEMTLTALDRERHRQIITVCRELGVRVRLFEAGDIAAAIETCFDESAVDIMMGSGGAPEGVIAAAAIRALGGYMEGRLIPENQAQGDRCLAMGVEPMRIYTLEELVKSDDIFFAATGITDSVLVKGIRYEKGNIARTDSVVIRGKTGTSRNIQAIHHLDKKPYYAR
ncbi:MAG: fructose 1,6-bisphosphatase [delta proteobacterium ML8_F1]|nr:MAG: fructose 1,6-bisphosphatase [delta proteobacterium ML8_F1]